MDLSRYLPSLVEYYPNEGSTNVPVTGLTITLKFSTALHRSVSGQVGSFFTLTQANATQVVPLRFLEFADEDKTVRLGVSGALLPDTAYLFVISPELPSSRGRQAGLSRSFSFRTSRIALGTPIPLQPAEAEVVQLPVRFDWNLAPYTGTGTTVYQLQIASDERFASVVYDAQTGTRPVDLQPSGLVPNRQYWWRVRALVTDGNTVTVTGGWSQITSFLLGPVTGLATQDVRLFPTAPPEVVWAYDGADGLFHLSRWPPLEFLVVGSLPPVGVPTLLSWLGMGFFFVITGSQNIAYRFVRRPVDGYPSSDWQPVSGTVEYPTSGLVRFVPSDPEPVPNSVYRFSLAVGEGQYHHFTWTSRYQPFYVSYEAVLSHLGPELEQYLGKETIYLQLYRTSLDANRHWMRWYGMPPWLGGPSESEVRTLRVVPTYAMERWCEMEATARLLQVALHAKLREYGTSQRLGDYQESHDVDAIRELRILVREYRREAERWLAEFGKKRSPAVISRYRVAFPQTLERRTDWSGGVPDTRDFG